MPNANPGYAVMGRVTLPWFIRYVPNRILLLDDMEGVLKWAQIVGTVARVSNVEVFEGTHCLQLTTGAVAGNFAVAERELGFPGASKFNLALRWHVDNAADNTLRDFQIWVTIDDGVNRHTIRMQYVHTAWPGIGQWQYWNGAWVNVPNGAQRINTIDNSPHYLRFGWYLYRPPGIRQDYLKLEAENLTVDLANINYQLAVAGVNIPKITIRLLTTTDVNLASSVYVDAFLLTDQD